MTLPNIPDNFFKFLVFVGLVIIAFVFFKYTDVEEAYNISIDNYHTFQDSLKVQDKSLESDKSFLRDRSRILSNRKGIKNPVFLKDSMVTFIFALPSDKYEKFINDTLYSLYWNYAKGVDVYNKMIKLTDLKYNKLQEDEDYNNSYYYNLLLPLAIIGVIMLFIGLAGYFRSTNVQETLLTRQLNEKSKYFKYCQSCGKIFSSIVTHSKEKDGSTNYSFCCRCYKDGIFTDSSVSLRLSTYCHRI